MGTASGVGRGYHSSRQRSAQIHTNNWSNNDVAGDDQQNDSSSDSRRKRVLPPPSTPADVLHGVVMATARAYMFLPTQSRAITYAIIIVIGSCLGKFNWPMFYLAEKHNLFNQVFAKFSLGWTLALLTPFVYFTSKVYSGNTTRNMRQQLARLIVAIVVWYMSTGFFDFIQSRTSTCSLPKVRDRTACKEKDGEWIIGFDISGHTFLLTYLCLIIVEEIKVMRNWDAMSIMLEQADDSATLIHLPPGTADASRTAHKEHTILIKRLFMAITVFTLLWEIQLIITLLYYHTVMHKIIGGFVAIGAWSATYRGWYTKAASPGMPGHGPLAYSTWRVRK